LDEQPFRATAWPFVAGPADAPRQAIGLTWDGAEPPAVLLIDGVAQTVGWQREPGGPARAEILVPLAETERRVELSMLPADGTARVWCPVKPPRRWELFLVNQSHVDIGYTEYPDILADAHGDYVSQALDLMTATDARPEAERFRWTCEASWTVEQFLRRHPARAEEFARRVRERRMELTALYCNLTDLFGDALLDRAILDAARLRDRLGIELVTACNHDINGLGWSLPDLLSRAGVRYLDMAINETRALGVRPRPTALTWAGPAGGEVLLWHSSGYLIGNKLHLHLSPQSAAPHVAEYLLGCEREGYPHWGMEILMSGRHGDSMPPSGDVCEVVADWNSSWLWPRLRLATAREWFEHLELHWPRPLQRLQKAWPDWWADGNGSAVYEAALARRTQARLVGLEAQRAVLSSRGIDLPRLDEQYDAAWRRLMLFCEHTWGAYEAAIDPDAPVARGQWHAKAAHVYAADALADSIELEQMMALATDGRVSARASGQTNATLQGNPARDLASSDPAAVVVFNPLPVGRDDVVRVHVPGHLSGGEAPGLRDGRSDEAVPVVVGRYRPEDVVNARHFWIEFLARDLPPQGHAVFWIDRGAIGSDDDAHVAESPHFLVELDPASGAIRHLVHRRSGLDLVQPDAGYLLNEAIYERVTSPNGRLAVASWPGVGGTGRDAEFERTPLSATAEAQWSMAPIGQSVVVTAGGPHGIRLVTRIDLPAHAERVDITNVLEKPATVEAEALYQAFPLVGGSGQIHLSVPGGSYRPGLDQVAGTATDWHSVQDWFAVAGSEYAVVVATPDVPLVQCTAINTGRWHQEMPPSNGLVMSWVLNNYWFTNFPVRQGGRITYRYSIALQEGPFDPDHAARFGAHMRRRAWGRAVRLSPSRALR
jgi:hypothetical protein